MYFIKYMKFTVILNQKIDISLHDTLTETVTTKYSKNRYFFFQPLLG